VGASGACSEKKEASVSSRDSSLVEECQSISIGSTALVLGPCALVGAPGVACSEKIPVLLESSAGSIGSTALVFQQDKAVITASIFLIISFDFFWIQFQLMHLKKALSIR
jgi:hypothetical protein